MHARTKMNGDNSASNGRFRSEQKVKGNVSNNVETRNTKKKCVTTRISTPPSPSNTKPNSSMSWRVLKIRKISNKKTFFNLINKCEDFRMLEVKERKRP